MKRTKSPLVWLGGKFYMRNKIVPILEAIPHARYIEPFGGGASILLYKERVDIETYNDIDSILYDFFTVLSDPDMFAEFERRVAVLPSSRQMYDTYRFAYLEEDDLVKRVAMWFLVNRQSFSGHHSWAVTKNRSYSKVAKTVSAWLGGIALLPEVHHRLQSVQFDNKTWESVIEQHDHPDALFYCDPPYMAETRKSGTYKHEMTDLDHHKLLDVLCNLKGSAVLSGYRSDLYTGLVDKGWHELSWDTYAHSVASTTQTGAVGKGAMANHKRLECVWVSPNAVEYIPENL